MKKLFDKIFLEHPRMFNETYFQHLWFTLKIAARLSILPFTLIIHGLLPPFFTSYTSTTINKLSDEFKAHKQKMQAQP